MRRTCFRSLLLHLLPWFAAAPVHGQLDNPVYVDDSPQARELFLRARDQVKDNTGEAVRLLQELLDEYGAKLLPINSTSGDHFVAARQRVIEEIASDPALLERYQLVETAEAQRLLDSGELQRLVMTRSLTEAGLEGMMRVAQDAVETTKFYVALHWLDEVESHPLRGQRHEVFLHMMRGIAARGIGDTELVRQSIARLGELAGVDAEACRRQVEALAAAAIPAPQRGVTPLTRAAVNDLQALVSQPIWRVELETRVRPDDSQPPNDLDPELGELVMRESGRPEAVTTTATVGPAAVYVTTSNAVHALDRYTGRAIWSQPYSLSNQASGSFSSDGMGSFAMNVSALEANSLVAFASDPRLQDGRVVCLDPHSGRERWTRSITEIAGRDDTENIMPHGAAVIAEGLVFVMARKVTRQLLTSCYVVALDIETGEVRWSRHIASVGGTFNRDMRPLTTVVYDRGDLYVDSSVGAVARITASTGEIRWLRRFTAPITAVGRGRAPFELGGAVLTSRGVLALQSDLNRVALLDRESGFDIEWHDASTASGWGSPRYLLANDEFVYAVGRDVRAFHLDNLGEPYWRLPESTPQGRLRSGLGDRSIDIRGRVQVVEGSLIVPTADGVLLVEDSSGVLQHELAMDSLGNPVALDSQLLVAGRYDVASYMPFDRAEQILRQRIASDPGEARPALSLLEMSIRARNLALVLEAAELARAAIGADSVESGATAQRELFTLLLEADRQRLAKTAEEGESLHAMIGGAAFDAATMVEHLLAKGDWISATTMDLGRAVETYQEILRQPSLAATPREQAMIVRSASDAATQRLAALIERNGEMVYSQQAAEAARQLDAIAAATSGDRADALLSIAHQYPLSDAAVRATASAADELVRRGETRRALAALLASYRVRPDSERAAELLRRVVSICQAEGWLDLATSIMAHAGQRHPGVELQAGDGQRADWGVHRRDSRNVAQTSTGHLLGESARPLSGRLVVAAGAQGTGHAPDAQAAPVNAMASSMLLIDGRTLRRVDLPMLQERWSHDIGEADPQLLFMDDQRVMLWLGQNIDDPHAIMLGMEDHRPLWPGPSLRFDDALGPEAGDDQAGIADVGRVDVQTPDGRLINGNEILPLVDRERLILVRRTGDVAALDLQTGQTKQWAKADVMDQVHLVELTDWGLVVAGMSMVWNDVVGASEAVGQIVVLDPATGERVAALEPSGRQPVLWMRLTELGELLIGTAGGVELLDVMAAAGGLAGELGGRSREFARIWSNAGHYAQMTRRAWMSAETCVVEDRNRMVRSIDLATGNMTDPFDVGVRGQPGEGGADELVDVRVTREAVASLYTLRVVMTDKKGAMVGCDVIAEEREYKALEPVAGGWVLLSRHASAQDVLADGRSRRTQHTYRLYNLSENGAVIGDPLELEPIAQRLQSMHAVDGWMILSFEDMCVAVQAPVRK